MSINNLPPELLDLIVAFLTPSSDPFSEWNVILRNRVLPDSARLQEMESTSYSLTLRCRSNLWTETMSVLPSNSEIDNPGSKPQDSSIGIHWLDWTQGVGREGCYQRIVVECRRVGTESGRALQAIEDAWLFRL